MKYKVYGIFFHILEETPYILVGKGPENLEGRKVHNLPGGTCGKSDAADQLKVECAQELGDVGREIFNKTTTKRIKGVEQWIHRELNQNTSDIDETDVSVVVYKLAGAVIGLVNGSTAVTHGEGTDSDPHFTHCEFVTVEAALADFEAGKEHTGWFLKALSAAVASKKLT